MELNWEAIGAIGEIVGAIAVVTTLMYLVKETKKNSRAIDATSSRDVALCISEWHREVAGNPGLKRIMLKSMKPVFEEHSDEEWFEFRVLAVSLFGIYQNHFVNRSLSIGSSIESEIYLHYAGTLITTFPAWKEFWERELAARSFYPEFVQAVKNEPGADISSFAEAKGAGIQNDK